MPCHGCKDGRESHCSDKALGRMVDSKADKAAGQM